MYTFEKKITVRVSEKQLAKIEDSGLNTSDFLRCAIDNFNVEDENRLIEYHNHLLKEIEENLKEQQKSFRKELDEKYKNQEHELISELNEQKKDYIQVSSKHQSEFAKRQKDREKLFRSILPTLQALKQNCRLSDQNLQYQASRINVTTKELKDWIRENRDLLDGVDYLFRETQHLSPFNNNFD